MHWNFLIFALFFYAWLPLENMGEEVYLIIYAWVQVQKVNNYKYLNADKA